MGGATQRSDPELARQRHLVSVEYADGGQHDAVEFLDRLLAQVRQVECSAGRHGQWEHVQVPLQVATHGDRLFRSVREVRRRCTACVDGEVRSWFSAESVWPLVPECVEGGAVTVSEMYLKSCEAQMDELHCPACGVTTNHVSQARMLTMPNVLLLQVRREPGAVRVPVDVEERLELPGLPAMELAGVVYHYGATPQTGHYTCVCRGPGGRYWFYDDSRAVVLMQTEVSRVKPREVYLLAYCRVDGCAVWEPAASSASRAGKDNAGFGGGGAGGGAGGGGGGGGSCSGDGVGLSAAKMEGPRWASFTPKVVDAGLCQARVWAGGLGGQCDKEPEKGRNLCRSHARSHAHGLVTGDIPEAKFREFQKAEARRRWPEPEVGREGREKRARGQEESGDGGGQQAEERASAAEGRAEAAEQRGIGDVGRARQMAARAKARADLDEKEKRGRGRD